MRWRVYERCEWLCSICDGAVDRNEPNGTLWGASLDHIIPVSRGGTHDEDNLALAHLWCNSVKRDLPLDEARALLAVVTPTFSVCVT